MNSCSIYSAYGTSAERQPLFHRSMQRRLDFPSDGLHVSFFDVSFMLLYVMLLCVLQALLSEADELWVELRHDHIAKVLMELDKRFKDVLRDNAGIHCTILMCILRSIYLTMRQLSLVSFSREPL
jgi:hypothetical protein